MKLRVCLAMLSVAMVMKACLVICSVESIIDVKMTIYIYIIFNYQNTNINIIYEKLKVSFAFLSSNSKK